MPTITNANIYAPTMMIAEKAADEIRGARPLPPLRVDTAERREQRSDAA